MASASPVARGDEYAASRGRTPGGARNNSSHQTRHAPSQEDVSSAARVGTHKDDGSIAPCTPEREKHPLLGDAPCEHNRGRAILACHAVHQRTTPFTTSLSQEGKGFVEECGDVLLVVIHQQALVRDARGLRRHLQFVEVVGHREHVRDLALRKPSVVFGRAMTAGWD